MSDPIDAVCVTLDAGELLRYSLRSLERHAPWLRRLYVVTNGPAPAWLEDGGERLAVFPVEQLFRERSALPTANLNAIEWHLHRIPKLSRRFLYLPADCFLARETTPDDFFTSKSGYRIFTDAIDGASPAAEALLNARFGNHAPRQALAIAPRMLDRDFLEELERIWSRQIKQTVSHTASDADDVSMEWLFSYYLLECPQQAGAHEAVSLSGQRKEYVDASLESVAGALTTLAGLKVSKPKFLRLTFDQDASLVRKSAFAFLKSAYGRRAAFEKD